MKADFKQIFLLGCSVLPWLLLGCILGLRLALPVTRFRETMMGELGPIELGTVALLLVAIGIGLKRIGESAGMLRLWHLAVVAGCVYFAGEELSWGQHLVGWQTPESLAALNDQGETNLHNMSSWLDQKPRLALELWIALGVVHAALVWRRHGSAAALRQRFLPGLACLSAGVAVVLARLPERLADFVHWAGQSPFDIRLSEVQELLIALHLLIYLAAAALHRPPDPAPS